MHALADVRCLHPTPYTLPISYPLYAAHILPPLWPFICCLHPTTCYKYTQLHTAVAIAAPLALARCCTVAYLLSCCVQHTHRAAALSLQAALERGCIRARA